MSKRGIVNVRMVITEEKILSNIDKVQRIINPKSKKQIIELDDNSYFKDLIESIKTYLIEYPKKKNFPKSVYDQAYRLVEYAINQFEVSTKQIEELMKQKEYNIKSAIILKQTIALAESKDPTWKKASIEISKRLSPDILEAINLIGNAEDIKTEEIQSAIKKLNARILNLQSNLYIEIDIERYEDRLKALSFIGIEISDALKTIPTPADSEFKKQQIVEKQSKKVIVQNQIQIGQKVNQPKVQLDNQPQQIRGQVVNQQNVMQKAPIQNIQIGQQQKLSQNVIKQQPQMVHQQVQQIGPNTSVEPKVQLAKGQQVIQKQQVNYIMQQQMRTRQQAVINQPQMQRVEPIAITPMARKLEQQPVMQQKQQVNQFARPQIQNNQPLMSMPIMQQQNMRILQPQMINQNNRPTIDDFMLAPEEYNSKKPSLWERIKNSKLIKAIKFLFGSKNATLALPEGQNGYTRY